MDKKFRVKNLRFVALLEPDTTFLGYDIVELGKYDGCVSVFDENKRYPYAETVEEVKKMGQVTALKSAHSSFKMSSLNPRFGKVSKDNIDNFVLRKGTDIKGTFYFPNYEGAKVKKYGDNGSK